MSLAVRILACAGLAVLVLAACRESEQGRMTHYEKGVYQGKADTPLNDDALRALRARHGRMAGTRVVGGGGGGGGGSASSSGAVPTITIAPPTGSDLDARLRSRAARQSFN